MVTIDYDALAHKTVLNPSLSPSPTMSSPAPATDPSASLSPPSPQLPQVESPNNTILPSGTAADLLDAVDKLKFFLATAPSTFPTPHPVPDGSSSVRDDRALNCFLLPTGELISCVMWNGLYHVTGTDIVRALNFRFLAFGRPVRNAKKFEEGVFSDLRNLKSGVDATLEEPKVSLRQKRERPALKSSVGSPNFSSSSSSTTAFGRRKNRRSSTGFRYLTIASSSTLSIGISSARSSARKARQKLCESLLSVSAGSQASRCSSSLRRRAPRPTSTCRRESRSSKSSKRAPERTSPIGRGLPRWLRGASAFALQHSRTEKLALSPISQPSNATQLALESTSLRAEPRAAPLRRGHRRPSRSSQAHRAADPTKFPPTNLGRLRILTRPAFSAHSLSSKDPRRINNGGDRWAGGRAGSQAVSARLEAPATKEPKRREDSETRIGSEGGASRRALNLGPSCSRRDFFVHHAGLPRILPRPSILHRTPTTPSLQRPRIRRTRIPSSNPTPFSLPRTITSSPVRPARLPPTPVTWQPTLHLSPPTRIPVAAPLAAIDAPSPSTRSRRNRTSPPSPLLPSQRLSSPDTPSQATPPERQRPTFARFSRAVGSSSDWNISSVTFVHIRARSLSHAQPAAKPSLARTICRLTCVYLPRRDDLKAERAQSPDQDPRENLGPVGPLPKSRTRSRRRRRMRAFDGNGRASGGTLRERQPLRRSRCRTGSGGPRAPTTRARLSSSPSLLSLPSSPRTLPFGYVVGMASPRPPPQSVVSGRAARVVQPFSIAFSLLLDDFRLDVDRKRQSRPSPRAPFGARDRDVLQTISLGDAHHRARWGNRVSELGRRRKCARSTLGNALLPLLPLHHLAISSRLWSQSLPVHVVPHAHPRGQRAPGGSVSSPDRRVYLPFFPDRLGGLRGPRSRLDAGGRQSNAVPRSARLALERGRDGIEASGGWRRVGGRVGGHFGVAFRRDSGRARQLDCCDS